MDAADLKAMTIPAAEDCVLFMWAIDPMLPQAFELITAWGFTYKTVAFTWAKINESGKDPIGGGYWTRANPEMCLLATRGKPKRLNADVRQLLMAPRREHSRKPAVHERIERLVGGPYLEMFARQERPGWDAWGNEVERFNPKPD
jgi:N6-adenosine-specific RNA methylase IME4